MNVAVDFKNVSIIFGDQQDKALAMAKQGVARSEILEKTGAVLGCYGADLIVNEGEISVLMGLSGSGKSTLLRAVNRLNHVTSGNILVKSGDGTVDVATCDETALRATFARNRSPWCFSNSRCCHGARSLKMSGLALNSPGLQTLSSRPASPNSWTLWG
jgi:ABC-type proline/glycine betaine transport system ATPase subunit